MLLTDRTENITEEDEETLLEELGEVAHIDETRESVVVFASPSETSAIGTQVIQMLGGWLLFRRRQRREQAASTAPGSQTNLSPTSVN